MTYLSCYIAAMLPSPLTDRIQRFMTHLVLVIVVLALPLVPARHVLVPLWPRPIDELLWRKLVNARESECLSTPIDATCWGIL